MSLIVNENEVMSDFYIDSDDKKLGKNAFSFTVPLNQSFINFNRITRIALAGITMSYLPYNIFDGNNRITLFDGTNTFISVLPYGNYDFINSSSPRYFLTPLQNAMNANPYGWVFTLAVDPVKSNLTWTSSVPIQVVTSTMSIVCGIFKTTSLSTSYAGAVISGQDSPIFYVCSRALTKNSVRDAHTNSIINNVLGTISIDDEKLTGSYNVVRRQVEQMKVFDWSPSEPLGGEIDIYFIDQFGTEITDYSEYKSSRMILEFKLITTRNPITQTLLRQY
jgi:hypothetical protein